MNKIFYKILKKILENSINIHKKQEGSISVIVALIMVSLIGMSGLVLDLGGAYIKASEIQNALDSAALAAVQELPALNTSDQKWLDAKNAGAQYASVNGLDQVDFEPIIKGGRISGIKAKGTIESEYTFAKVLGFKSGEINRAASAEILVVDGMSGLLPMSATVESMEELLDNPEKIVYLKGGPQDKLFFGDNGGWRGFWAPDNGKFNVEGYSEMIRVGKEVVVAITGVKTNATDEIYESRFDGHEICTLDNYRTNCPDAPDCSRIVTIPIVEVFNNKELMIRGFASFFLEQAIEENNEIKAIKASYIDKIVVSGSSSGGTANDYGVYVWKLTN